MLVVKIAFGLALMAGGFVTSVAALRNQQEWGHAFGLLIFLTGGCVGATGFTVMVT